jgi:hypothetical protein
MAASASPVHKFVTYNILSQALCGTSSFSKYPAEQVDVDARWELIAGKLSAAMAEGAIISLQEVSQEWAARLSILCSKDAANPYTPIWRPYGSDFSDHMGVALLVPVNKYELAKVRIARVGKELSRLIPSKRHAARPAPPDDAPATPSIVETAISTSYKFASAAVSMVVPPIVATLAQAAWTAILGLFGVSPPAALARSSGGRRKSVWATARARHNAIVYAVLKPRAAGFSAAGSEGAFAVSTYHMPCCFMGPSRSIMTLHTWTIARLLHEWSSADDGVPVVLGGDFNYKPIDRQYRLLSTGRLLTDEEEAAAEATGEYELDDPRIQDCSDAPAAHDASHRRLPEGLVFTSAYKAVHGAEPDMTNFNAADMVPGPDPFIDALDFVWLSDGLRAVGAVELPSRTDPEVVKGGPYPSATEPSDHAMLSISFRKV